MGLDAGKEPVLVTGATGFLGGHLARTLLSRGIAVRATGRNLANGKDLLRLGADFRPVDLRDRAAMMTVCQGVRSVIHSGALSSAWGKYQDFYEINVEGTQNVIDGCLAQGVERLVYISSPSVMTRLEPQLNLTEADPLPETFVSKYSETKKLAEDRVHEAHKNSLATVILRPKAIYGPGDNAIFPRLIEAASRKRLPVIGDGDTLTDLTHVDDVVEACILALDNPNAAGNTYLIIGNKAVRIWDVIHDVVARLEYEAPKRRLTLTKAMRIAKAFEFIWRTFHLPGEPLLTEYKVGILGISQTYDISAAERDLGYQPKVALEDGIQSVLDSLQGGTTTQPTEKAPETTPESDPVAVELELMKSGSTHTFEKFFLPDGKWRKIDVPAMFALLKHPNEGYILFDTGYSRRFFEGTRRLPFKMASIVTPASVPKEEEAVQQVRAREIAPEDIHWVILSHFDPDHYGGLKDFPNARIVCTVPAWESVVGKQGMAAFKVRLLPGHLPEDIAARLYLLPDFDGPPIPPFPRSHDLFGDGAIRFVEVPGHAAGQVAAFVRTKSEGEVFLAADACWNLASLDKADYRGGMHRVIAVDKSGQDATYKKMRELRAARPELKVVPTHCPEVWGEVSIKGEGV